MTKYHISESNSDSNRSTSSRNGRQRALSGPLGAGLALALLIGAAPAWGQQASNLVCSGCVQASDLANGAVTSAKIGGGEVTNGKLANSAVNSVKIATGAVTAPKLAPNSVNPTKITTGAISSAKLAPGAVNVTKLANSSVSSEKIQVGAVTTSRIADGAVTADKLAASLASGLTNTVQVGNNGTAAENCTALRDELAAITDASATNPYVILLGPGVFDCGVQPLSMKAHVSIHGQGRNATFLEATFEGSDTVGLIHAASDSELRGVTIDHAGAVGVVIDSASNFRLTDALVMSGAGGSARGVNVAGTAPEAVLTNVEILSESASNCRGILVGAGVVTLNNVSATCTGGGSINWGGSMGNGTLIARNSVFQGDDAGYHIFGGLAVGQLANTQVINGLALLNGATITCFSVYDVNFNGGVC